MIRAIACLVLTAMMIPSASGQSTEPKPAFEVADVHVSPRTTNPIFRAGLHGERYEVHNATMLDLIRTAYSFDADKVSGGPSWLEYNRFDVTALAPANTPQDQVKLMLQSLLDQRFKLVVHNDTRPVAAFILSMGKGKPKLREADVSGKTGCQTQPIQMPAAPTPDQIRVPMMGIACHNTTMEAFVTELKGIGGGGYVTNVVVDSTGLKGSWDFDYKFTLKPLAQLVGADAVTLPDAIDKQLGLKLEEQKVPTPVIVVDQVNEKPRDNPPDLAKKLPPLPPAEFEVADIKPVNPGVPLQQQISGGIGVLPGGRVNLPGFLLPLKQLILLAWNLNSNDDIAGAPKWLDSARYDIIAKLPAGYVSPNGAAPPLQDLGPMLQALLIDRFKLKFHFEDQMVTAYSLVAAKPKLKKADPSNRTGCKDAGGGFLLFNNGSPVAPSRTVSCQNMTMAQFADHLLSLASQYVHYPVVDATGLEGAWDFTLSFSPITASQLAGLRASLPPGVAAGAPGGPGGGANASDPVGGTSLLDAIDKQLGLKLEAQKRSYPVFVLDHIEEKPTEN
jgi:uncharacterized protein (TIGR03435 family)